MKLIRILFAGAGTLALLTSCATTTEPGAKQALVCPQCNSAIGGTSLSDEGQPYSFALTHGGHECPGCRGTLRSMLAGNVWEHECAICKEQPFQCAISQPRAS